MKITKRQLRRIIREERHRLMREQSDRYEEFDNFDPLAAAKPSLYTNLSDEQLEALDALEDAMATCKHLGVPSEDMMDTIHASIEG